MNNISPNPWEAVFMDPNQQNPMMVNVLGMLTSRRMMRQQGMLAQQSMIAQHNMMAQQSMIAQHNMMAQQSMMAQHNMMTQQSMMAQRGLIAPPATVAPPPFQTTQFQQQQPQMPSTFFQSSTFSTVPSNSATTNFRTPTTNVLPESSKWKRSLMDWNPSSPGLIKDCCLCPAIVIQSPTCAQSGNPILVSRISFVVWIIVTAGWFCMMFALDFTFMVFLPIVALVIILAPNVSKSLTLRRLRQTVRQKFGIRGDGSNDCLVATFCDQCLLCQVWTEMEYRAGKSDLRQITIVEGDTVILLRRL